MLRLTCPCCRGKKSGKKDYTFVERDHSGSMRVRCTRCNFNNIEEAWAQTLGEANTEWNKSVAAYNRWERNSQEREKDA